MKFSVILYLNMYDQDSEIALKMADLTKVGK